jgi:hypothetical protein
MEMLANIFSKCSNIFQKKKIEHGERISPTSPARAGADMPWTKGNPIIQVSHSPGITLPAGRLAGWPRWTPR